MGLIEAWAQRKATAIEGLKLMLEGQKLEKEGSEKKKLTKPSSSTGHLAQKEAEYMLLEGMKKRTEGTQMMVKANLEWAKAIVAEKGEVNVEWKHTKEKEICVVGGEVFEIATFKDELAKA